MDDRTTLTTGEGSPPLTLEGIWRRYDAIESRLTASLSERMLDLAGLEPGMRVLDLATGRGEPALRAARRVGSQGSVLGIDLSEAMLRMAREAADRDGLTNLDLRAGNAELLEDIPRNHFHAATVRWGLMYMAAPVAALARARRALVPSGILVAALWVEPKRASFFTLPRRILEHYRRWPLIDPEAPGIFRYADHARAARDFEQAGFMLDHVEDMEVTLFEAETAREVVTWVRALGSGLGQLVTEMPANDQGAWEKDLADTLERSRTDGLIRMGGVTRIVRARPI
jgi:ubiquinone/menaquinone biosynthesis C-methylase UbiE